MEAELQRWKEQIRERLLMADEMEKEETFRLIEETVLSQTRNSAYSAKEKRAFVETIFHSLRGYDVLQPLLDDGDVTEIMINSHEEIFVERRGQMVRHPGKFESRERLEDIIQAIVGQVNRAVNEFSPIVDARLQDGSRVNVVMPPIALKGPTMTIRKFPLRPLTMDDLIQNGTLPPDAAQFLERLVKARYNILISGGTSSGKTTFLNILSNFIPAQERIITIEDTAELQIAGIPNLVRLETRNMNTEGKGEITIRDLIRTSLRMRPDRIIVGEVRGAEALDMLQAMNTGHDGSLSTGHANSARDMLSRLEAMVLEAVTLPVGVVRSQISSAVDILIHLGRVRDRSRKVMEIAEIVGVKDGEIQLNPLYLFEEHGDETEKGSGVLKATGHPLVRKEKMKRAGLMG